MLADKKPPGQHVKVRLTGTAGLSENQGAAISIMHIVIKLPLHIIKKFAVLLKLLLSSADCQLIDKGSHKEGVGCRLATSLEARRMAR